MTKVLTLTGLVFIFLVGMFNVACSSPQPSATPLPTPNPDPTAVPVSLEPPTLTPIPSPSPNIEATVEARLAAALEAIPSPTPMPTVTPIPTETPTSTPIPTLEPSLTPTPTAKPTSTPLPTPKPSQTSTPAPSPTPTLTLTPTPTPTLIPIPTSIPSAWHDWVAEDRLTGEKAALFRTEATYHNLEWPYDAPSLVVRCVGKNSAEEVFIVWDKYMSSGIEGIFIGAVRFDSDSPSTVLWSESTNNESTFADDPARLLAMLKPANTAFFRIQDFSGEDHDAEFKVTGLSDAMAKYPDLCRG